MKRIKLVINDSSIAKLTGSEVEIFMEDEGTVLDLLVKLDEVVRGKGAFPYPEYKGLLHMIYNPVEDRLYKQVGLHAHTPGKFYNVRNNIHHELVDGMTVILVPYAGCISHFEEPLSYEEFTKALSKRISH